MAAHFFLMAWWPLVHEGQESETTMERFIWSVNMTEVALWESVKVNQYNFIPEYREDIGLEMVARESPNLH